MDVESLFGVQGATVLVTGGAQGIGKMIATAFVANGATVYIASRSGVDQTANELTALGPGKCIGVACDLLQYEEVERLAKRIAEAGILNVLVNCAGMGGAAPFDEYSDEMWTTVLTLNVQRIFTLIQKVAPLLEKGAERDGKGRVINIGTIYALSTPRAESYAYTSSKAALHKHLAERLGPRGITVNAIAPGPFVTRLLSSSVDASLDEIAQSLPRRRLGKPEDIGAACLWLSGAGGAWVTGDIIPVDGGSLLVPQGVL